MMGFWRTWMLGWCWAVGLFGVILAGGAVEAASGPVRLLLDILNGPAALQIDAPLRFSLAVMGAVTMGWSVTLFAAVRAANQLGAAAQPIWALIAASVATWFVIDSTLSLVTGFGLNVVPNTVFLAAFLAPLLATGVLRKPGTGLAR